MITTEDISNTDNDPQGDAERQLVGANWFRGQGEITFQSMIYHFHIFRIIYERMGLADFFNLV